jgi:uncharacterized membrane protein YvbJ
MSFCPQCGSQFKPNTRFCGSCGTPIEPQEEYAPLVKTMKTVLPKAWTEVSFPPRILP